MNQSEIEQLVRAIKDSHRGGETFDFISKIASVLCTAAIVWVATQITSLDRDLAILRAAQQSIVEDTKQLKQFTRQPRFTRDDFIIEMKVWENRIAMVELELQRRKTFMTDVENSMDGLNAKIRELEKFNAYRDHKERRR